MDKKTAAIAIIIMAVVTAAIRFAPFLLFRRKNVPKAVSYLGRVLPCAVMGMLVIYCLKDITFTQWQHFVPQMIAAAVVVGSYIWKKNTLFSIILGTGCYMILLRTIV